VVSVGQNWPVRTPYPSSCPLPLADSREEEYHLKHAFAHLYQGGMDTVQGILTFMKRLTSGCLQSLQQRFVVWTKPDTTSLLLLKLPDQARSKSELVAENARLASTIDHPASTRETACLYSDGPQTPGPAGKHSADLETGPVIVQEDDASAVASSGLQALLEGQVAGSFSQAKNIPGDRRLEEARWQGTTDCGELNASGVNCSS
jgi:hypothetical protein